MTRFSSARSLTRFVIGASLNGLDGLTHRLEIAESQLYAQDAVIAAPPKVAPKDMQTISEIVEPTPVGPVQSAVVGLVFSTQKRAVHYLEITDRATRLAGKWAELLGAPIYNSRWMSPARQWFKKLETRGQTEVDRWQALGQTETAHSRLLAQRTINERVDTAINYLTTNEEVQELVQSQSVSLVDEVIEEARERSISADNYLESFVRSMFRKPPRSELSTARRELTQVENRPKP